MSELVTNAVVHGEGQVEVQLTTRGSLVRLEVLDEGHDAATPAPREVTPGLHGGWGLHLLDELSDSWGAVTGPHETRVWMERDIAQRDARSTERDIAQRDARSTKGGSR